MLANPLVMSNMQEIAFDLCKRWFQNTKFLIFVALFAFRYARVLINIAANHCYKPTPIPKKPSFQPDDVTAIICTDKSLMNETLQATVRSALVHNIAKLILSTSGPIATDSIEEFMSIEEFDDYCRSGRLQFVHREERHRRKQTALALTYVTTKLLILCDDHTLWNQNVKFLPSLIAPFENEKIGGVAPILEGINHDYPLGRLGFYNFLGMTYLVRRSHDYRATNTIDGSMSTLPSRFAVFRSSIYKSEHFQQGYLNEYLYPLWGPRKGPLNADDDKFHTRYLNAHGWKIKFQASQEATAYTEIGEPDRFLDQCERWTRTSVRSNPRALISERSTIFQFPYSFYASLIYNTVKFSTLHEVSCIWLLKQSLNETGINVPWWLIILGFEGWCNIFRLLKIAPHFAKYPEHKKYFVPYVIFCWYSSWIKIKAICTMFDVQWNKNPATMVGESPSLKEQPSLGMIDGQQNQPGTTDRGMRLRTVRGINKDVRRLRILMPWVASWC